MHTYAQEIIENTLDYRHLPVLHHVAVQELEPPTPQGPLLRMRLRLGPDMPPALKQKIQADHTFLMAGLGYLRVELPLPSLGLVSYLWAMHNPTGPRRTHMLVAAALLRRAGRERRRGSRSPHWPLASRISTQRLLFSQSLHDSCPHPHALDGRRPTASARQRLRVNARCKGASSPVCFPGDPTLCYKR